MQHAVNVTAPGCCSFFKRKLPANPLDLNLQFVKSTPGVFKIAHTVIGVICLAVIAHFCQFLHPLTGSSLGFLCSNSAVYFLLVSYSCFVTSLILLISSIFSYFTASFLPKTAFEFAYHLTACISYLSSSIILLLALLVTNTDKGSYKEPGFEAKVAASALGMFNSFLYGVSTYYSFQSQKQMG